MQDANLKIKPDELEVILNSGFFHRKRLVSEKISALFTRLKDGLFAELAGMYGLPPGIHPNAFKISRGENYREMPYIILDFPKLFSREGVFACRSMFLWGNEFSFTLHIGGIYLDQYKEALFRRSILLKDKGFYYCINASPYEYMFDSSNYIPFELLFDENGMLNREPGANGFIKISRKLDLKHDDLLVSYGLETYRYLLSAMSPGDA